MKVLDNLLVLSLLVLISEASEEEYCKLCQYHTMCKTSVPGSTCNKHASKPPTAADIKVLLHAHNDLRNKVALNKETNGKPGPQPPASNMIKMEWDNELAKIAQRAADQCVHDHDCAACRTVIGERFGVGQNIAMQWNSQPITKVHFVKMARNWYESEVKLMNNSWVKQYKFGNKHGHYSQVVWWKSRAVGCGAALYFDNSMNMNTEVLFCNYGPPANMPGAMVYKIGEGASDCPENTVKDSTYTGLCAIDSKYDRKTKFPSDGILLGLPPGMMAMPPTCELKGFRAVSPSGGVSSSAPSGGVSSSAPSGGVSSSAPSGGVSSSAPSGGVSPSTPSGGVSPSTPSGGVSASAPSGGWAFWCLAVLLLVHQQTQMSH